MNLGAHVGDQPQSVERNRAVLQAAVRQAGGGELVFLNQVHGTRVLDLASVRPRLGGLSAQDFCADGLVTGDPAAACVMMVADCLPVLLADRLGRRVGAFHAGWRGLAGEGGVGVLESAVQAFGMLAAPGPMCTPADLVAWLGPCIGPTCFEVGHEVREAFVSTTTSDEVFFRATPQGKWLADLPGLARARLVRQGVRSIHGNDGSAAWCTVLDSVRFFSHRRDARRLGSTGRMAACIWLAA